MKTAWFIRHAESQSNVGKQTDRPESIELTEQGHKQAKALSHNINAMPGLIVTSPYLRTKQTALPLAKKYPDVKHEEWSVHEFTYLSPQKYQNTTVEQRIPWAKKYWEKSDTYYCDGDGAESFADFMKRALQTKHRIDEQTEEFVIVFSHMQFINALLWLKDKGSFTLDNVSSQDMQRFRSQLLNNQLANCEIVQYRS
ncbi:MAG: histidine phosphatase family protein [Planctomycetes bacterium]|nr:histidine phosphatase family protein [Planctomycetota bacterium]